MEPINLIGNNPGRHGLSASGRLAYLPEYVGASGVGLLFGHDNLSAGNGRDLPSLHSSRANLSIYGAYIDWNKEPWRVVGANYYVDVKLDQTTQNESFISGYLQLERQLPKRFTLFGRLGAESTRDRRGRRLTGVARAHNAVDLQAAGHDPLRVASTARAACAVATVAAATPAQSACRGTALAPD